MQTSSLLARVAALALGGLFLFAAPALGQVEAGGPSVGSGTSKGGDGGSSTVKVRPTAVSGDSGAATAGSSATNTGDTGAATSYAQSAPTATSGDSEGTGATGDARSAPTARDDAPLSSTATGATSGSATSLSSTAPAAALAEPLPQNPTSASAASTGAVSVGWGGDGPAAAAPPAVITADPTVDGSPVGYSTPLSRRASRAATTVLLALAGLVVALRIRFRLSVPRYAALF